MEKQGGDQAAIDSLWARVRMEGVRRIVQHIASLARKLPCDAVRAFCMLVYPPSDQCVRSTSAAARVIDTTAGMRVAPLPLRSFCSE